jgi:alkylated DNA nucleotide flippase Atl1
MATTALEKLRKPQSPEIISKMPKGCESWGPPGATMVISTPQEIDELVRQIPKGKLATITTLREAIAKRHGTTITCPITTGIFINIVAKAAEEMREMGAKRLTPWWRMLTPDGTLNEKCPGGSEAQAAHLKAEGFRIAAKGKNRKVVVDFERKLAPLA